MDDDAALSALARVTAAMSRATERADPAAAVPACPGWDVTALVDHLGRVHLWAAAAARTGREPRPYPRRDTSQPLAQWYAACAAALLDTLAALDPEQPAWTFFGPDQRVGFWRRRQVHETAVHLVDLVQATGEFPTSGLVTALPHLSSDEAADGVDEVLRVMAPRKLERLAPRPPEELVPAPRPVAFAADGTGRSWTLRLAGGQVLVDDGHSEDAVALVSAPAAHLYLALWGRAGRQELAVEGDRSAADRLLDAGLVP
jgi:uncharacterized protein (TIGR03083 family)